jgi:hypothetical protein
MKKNKLFANFFLFIQGSFFALFLFIFFFVQAKTASAWDALAAAQYSQMMEEIKYNIRGIQMGALKQASIQIIAKQMDRFIAGTVGGGSPRIITNWQDYLINSPEKKANQYVNDYISQVFSGRGSSSAYQSSSGSVLGASSIATEGFGTARVLGSSDTCASASQGDTCDLTDGTKGSCVYANGSTTLSCSASTSTISVNYAQDMQQMVQDEVISPSSYTNNFTGDPSNLVSADGTLSDLNLFVLGDNMPIDVKMNAVAVKQQAYQNEKDQAMAMAIANQGYKSTGEESGSITMPGSLIKDTQANINNLPNLALVNASNLSELVSAAVSKTIFSVTQSAIDGVQNSIDKSVNSVTDKAISQTNSAIKKYGPGVLYNK